MKAKITKVDGYKAAPMGYVTEVYPCGDIVEGKVADWAVADGAAEEIKPPRKSPETKVVKAPETKRKARKTK